MTTMLLSFLFFLVVVAAMAVGVLAGREPISGSCGGIAALGLDTECEICGGDPNKCDEAEMPETPAQITQTPSQLVYDAMAEPHQR